MLKCSKCGSELFEATFTTYDREFLKDYSGDMEFEKSEPVKCCKCGEVIDLTKFYN